MYGTGAEELAAAGAEPVSYGARRCADGLAVGSAGDLSLRAGGTAAITPSGIPGPGPRPAGIGPVACPVTFLVTPDGGQLPGDSTGQPETPGRISPAGHSRPGPAGSPQRRPPPL